jgi:CHAP domain
MAVRRGFGSRVMGALVAGGMTAAMLATAGPAAASGPGQLRSARPDPLPARAITLTAPERAALLKLYASYLGIPRSDIHGARPGTLHAALQVPAGTAWATARFLPALTAPASVQLRFQDGAGTVVFTRTHGQGWQVLRAGGEPLPCAGVLPASIQRAWRLTSTANCPTAARAASVPRQSLPQIPQAASATAIVQVATQNVGIGDTPASTDFSRNCNPYATLLEVGARSRHCRTDRHFGVRDKNQPWCADFVKWVWEQGGVTSDLDTLIPAASSFYIWGKQQGERMPADSSSPAPGDAVVFYPSGESPGDSFADHVGLVAAVNTNGTINLVDGDFAGSSNITVQATTNVSLAAWAAGIWGPGEKWVFVSPSARPPTRR